MHKDAAADPDHRRRADDRQDAHQYRHADHQSAADRAGNCALPFRQEQADVVHLHDQRDHTVNPERDRDADQRQHDRLSDDRRGRHFGKRDRHDFGRQDQVGADRARHFLRLQRRGVAFHRRGFGRMPAEDRLDDFLGPLITQIGAAEHQERGHQPRREGAQQQRRRKQDQQFVAQRPERDLADDRQFALGGEARDVARSHRGIVDDHAHRLAAGLAGCGGDVVERRGGELGDRGDIVEQCYES